MQDVDEVEQYGQVEQMFERMNMGLIIGYLLQGTHVDGRIPTVKRF